MNKLSEQEKSYCRELIWKNTRDLFEKRNSIPPSIILKMQRRYINSFNIKGKNKYKSVEILENYFKNPNKQLAEQIFWNTLYNKTRYRYD